MKLRAENIMKSYNGRKVVKGVSVEVNQGEIVGLLGPNGAGKTTSFYMIVGLIQPEHGSILVDNTDITKKPIHLRSQLGLSYLPQEPSIGSTATLRTIQDVIQKISPTMGLASC